MTIKSNEEDGDILLEWKKLYTEALIDALSPTGDVLEVGFDLGFAAMSIQKHRPKTHIIIESDPQVANEARKWANKNPNITIIQGPWKEVLNDLGTFDAIFFNHYPRVEQDIEITNFLFPKSTFQASREAQELLGLLEDQVAEITMKFSDSEIEDFYQKIGKFNLKELPEFFRKLKENGNISEEQYENAAKKYRFSELQEASASSSSKLPEKSDDTLLFLEECLQSHMHRGARFSSFLSSQISKYQDSQFFDKIITNPDVEYKEPLVSIKISGTTREALIMLVEKL